MHAAGARCARDRRRSRAVRLETGDEHQAMGSRGSCGSYIYLDNHADDSVVLLTSRHQ